MSNRARSNEETAEELAEDGDSSLLSTISGWTPSFLNWWKAPKLVSNSAATKSTGFATSGSEIRTRRIVRHGQDTPDLIADHTSTSTSANTQARRNTIGQLGQLEAFVSNFESSTRSTAVTETESGRVKVSGLPPPSTVPSNPRSLILHNTRPAQTTAPAAAAVTLRSNALPSSTHTGTRKRMFERDESDLWQMPSQQNAAKRNRFSTDQCNQSVTTALSQSVIHNPSLFTRHESPSVRTRSALGMYSSGARPRIASLASAQSGVSSQTRRILLELERISTPVRDCKRMGNTTPNTHQPPLASLSTPGSVSRLRSAQTSSPYWNKRVQVQPRPLQLSHGSVLKSSATPDGQSKRTNNVFSAAALEEADQVDGHSAQLSAVGALPCATAPSPAFMFPTNSKFNFSKPVSVTDRLNELKKQPADSGSQSQIKQEVSSSSSSEESDTESGSSEQNSAGGHPTPGASAGQWQCGSCSQQNAVSVLCCTKCFVAQPGSWKCTQCKLSNAAASVKCSSCKTDKTSGPSATSAAKWSCAECYASNEAAATKCSCCETAKPTANNTVAAHKPIVTTSLGAKWTCSSCMVPNEASAQACVCCNTPKPGVKTAGSSKRVPPSAAAKWSCPECLVPNDASAQTCVCCTTPKPGASASSSKGTSAAGNAMFGLGGASANQSLSSASTPVFGVSGSVGAAWTCGKCNVPMKASTCAICNSTRPAPSAVGGTATPLLNGHAAAPVPVPKWSCTTCYINNEGLRATCIACSAPKPGNTIQPVRFGVSSGTVTDNKLDTGAPARKTVRFKESIVSAGAAKIQFGAAVTPVSSASPAAFGVSVAVSPISASATTTTANMFSAPKPIITTSLGAKWTCSSCMVPNEASAQACVCCTTPKPGAKPETTTSAVLSGKTLPAFGLGAPAVSGSLSTSSAAPAPTSTSLFSFGASAAVSTADTSTASAVPTATTTAASTAPFTFGTAAAAKPPATNGLFTFGASTATATPSFGASTTAAVPAFGVSSASETTTGAQAPVKSTFSFGQPTAAPSTALTGLNSTASTNLFAAGTKSDLPPGPVFGNNPPAAVPSLLATAPAPISFPSNGSATNMFGAAPALNAVAPAPSTGFQFGAAPSAVPATFAFGGAAPAAGAPAFAFSAGSSASSGNTTGRKIQTAKRRGANRR